MSIVISNCVPERAVAALFLRFLRVIPLAPVPNPAMTPADITSTLLAKTTLPVAVALRVIVPEPLASIVKFSFVTDERTDTATPAVAAADLTLIPVAAELVEASTLKEGFVVPAGPVVNAFAEVDVIVVRAATAEPQIVVAAGSFAVAALEKSTGTVVFKPFSLIPGRFSSIYFI